MASERDLELLDDYIRERLSNADRAAFEQKLSGDTALQRELKVQQRIADGLRKARTAQLKTMLSNVPVAAVPTTASILAKVAGGLVFTGLVVTGVYFYATRNESAPSQEPVEQITPGTIDSASADTNNSISPESVTPTPEDRPDTETTKLAEKTTSTPATSPDAKIKAYNPADDQNAADGTTNVPQAGVTETNASARTSPVAVVDNTNVKYTFHYQFKEGKLILYGAFEKNLYEILEIFSDNKRTSFLYYKTNYYLLDEQGEDVKSLLPIKDETLLVKLREYRKNHLEK